MIISTFNGDNAFLSNFEPVEHSPFCGRTVEHFFQASKTRNLDERAIILNARTPGYAKRLGRGCTLVPNWDNVKVSCMKHWLELKFIRGSDLAEKLIATGDAILEEGNTWGDTFWGICPPNSGNGKNVLGKLLMEIREELRNA